MPKIAEKVTQDFTFPVRLVKLNAPFNNTSIETRIHAVQRTDNGAVFGPCSDNYGLIPYSTAIEKVEEVLPNIVGKEWKREIYVFAGGARMHAKYILPVQRPVKVGDIAGLVLNFYTSYDSTTRHKWQGGLFVLACLNGLVSSKWGIGGNKKHYSDITADVIAENAKIALNQANSLFDTSVKMAQIPITRDAGNRILASFQKRKFLPKKHLDQISPIWNNNPIKEHRNETLWDFYNAITYFYSNSNISRIWREASNQINEKVGDLMIDFVNQPDLLKKFQEN
jgi:hypothetical protein